MYSIILYCTIFYCIVCLLSYICILLHRIVLLKPILFSHLFNPTPSSRLTHSKSPTYLYAPITRKHLLPSPSKHPPTQNTHPPKTPTHPLRTLTPMQNTHSLQTKKHFIDPPPLPPPPPSSFSQLSPPSSSSTPPTLSSSPPSFPPTHNGDTRIDQTKGTRPSHAGGAVNNGCGGGRKGGAEEVDK